MKARADVLIVGAGAAGSVLAYRLSSQGVNVHVLERGQRLDPATVRHNEFEMMPRLYKRGGPQATADSNISILQGAGIGASTVVKNAVRNASSAQAGVLVGTSPRGVIGLRRNGRPRIRLTLIEQEIGAAIAAGLRMPARIFLAGDAEVVLPGLVSDVEIRTVDDVDRVSTYVRHPSDLVVGSARPQGGKTMREDPARGWSTRTSASTGSPTPASSSTPVSSPAISGSTARPA